MNNQDARTIADLHDEREIETKMRARVRKTRAVGFPIAVCIRLGSALYVAGYQRVAYAYKWAEKHNAHDALVYDGLHEVWRFGADGSWTG